MRRRRVMQGFDVDYKIVQVVADEAATWFRVLVNWLPITEIQLVYEGVRARWVCAGCAHQSGTKRQMLRHVVMQHFPLVAQAYRPKVLPRRIEAPAYPRIAGRWYEPRW
jgi:hypothetical protein